VFVGLWNALAWPAALAFTSEIVGGPAAAAGFGALWAMPVLGLLFGIALLARIAFPRHDAIRLQLGPLAHVGGSFAGTIEIGADRSLAAYAPGSSASSAS
jgi:hypothetical protein